MPHVVYKKGFTLLELIFVIAIMAFVIVAAAASLANFQAYVALDNAIRKIKTEIISAQVSARSNFIPTESIMNDRALPAVSLGWLVSFDVSSNSFRLIRRAIYFTPFANSSYKPTDVSADIENFRRLLAAPNVTFGCNGDQFVFDGNSSFTSVSRINLSVRCASANSGNLGDSKDYFESTYYGMTLFTQNQSAIPLCYLSSNRSGTPSRGVFFSSGYARPAISSSCQVRIEYVAGFRYTRALLIEHINGTTRICGNSC